MKVESLAFDIDFRAKIKRATFEEACSDLRGRFAKPILSALDNAGLTLVSALMSVDILLSKGY